MTDQEESASLLARRIKHVLGIYPKISPSMLAIALGPKTAADEWRPVLDELIVENEVQLDVVSSTSPSGRTQSYSIISLVNAHG